MRTMLSLLTMLLPAALFAANAKPAAKVEPPPSGEIVLRELCYEGKISDDEARFETTILAESTSKAEASKLLFEGDIAMLPPKLPNGARIERNGSCFRLFLARPGKYELKLTLLAKILRVEPWNKVRFKGPLAAISSITAQATVSGSELQLLSGTVLETGQTNGLSRVKGFLGAEQQVVLRWQSKKIEVTRRAVVTADTSATALVTPTVIKYATQFRFEVVQGSLPKLPITLPKKQTLTRLAGEQIRDWHVTSDGDAQTLVIEFIKPVEKSYQLTVFSEQAIEKTPENVSLTTPQPAGLDREQGAFTVSAEDTQVEIQSASGLRQINAPTSAVSAYRFNAHPFALELKLKRIEPLIHTSDRVTARLEETRFLITHVIDLNIEKAGVYALELQSQPGLVPTEVRAEGLDDWKISGSKLRINFSSRVLGQRRIEVQLEQPLKDFPGQIIVAPLRVDGATRETAQIGAASVSGIRLKTAELQSAREIPANRLVDYVDELLAYNSDQSDWKITLASEQLAARVVADIFNLITVGDGLAGGSATIRYGLINQGVQEFKLRVPPHWKNVEFTGPNIRRREQQGNVWTIGLQDKAWGGYTLVVTYDYPFDPKGATLPIGGIHAVEIERETGSVAITTAASLKLNAKTASDLLRRIDETELAPNDRALITRSVLLAYRYAGSDYDLSVDVKRFDELPVLAAVADRTQLTTVLTEAGDLLTQASFMVKNNDKQFQRFQLPEKARFWSCHVNGQPAKPERDGDWLLVPLPRGENRDQAFAVDIVYAETKTVVASWLPKPIHLEAPKTDVPNTYAEWQIYAPRLYRLSSFGGNMAVARGTTYDFRDAWLKFTDFYKWALYELFVHESWILVVSAIGIGVVALIVSAVRRGWNGVMTMCAIMVVVGLLAAMSIPNFVKARQTAQANTCVANLKQIDGAKEQWALENKKSPSDIPTWEDLVGPDKYIKNKPMCPMGGEYVLNSVSGEPMCLHGHTLSGSVPPTMLTTDERAMGEEISHGSPTVSPGNAMTNTATAVDFSEGRPMAAGIRSIHIEIPRTGQPFTFTKVLNVFDEPLTIKTDVMKLASFQLAQMAAQVTSFCAGLAIILWQRKKLRRNSFVLSLGIALAIGSVGSLLVTWRVLHIGLISGTPMLLVAIVGSLVLKRWRRRETKISEPLPGADPALASIALLLTLFTPAAEAKSSMPQTITPPASILSATYSGHVNDRVGQIDVTLQVSSSEPNQKLTLFGEEVVVENFSAKPADVKLLREGKTIAVLLAKKGEATLQFKLLVKLSGDVTKRALAFGIPTALTSKLSIVINQADAEVEFPSAISFKRETSQQQTRIDAVLAGEHVELHWTPRVKRVEEIAATVFVENSTLLTVGNGVVNAQTRLNYHVAQGELRQLQVVIPAGQRLLRLDGEAIRTWQTKTNEGHEILVVDLMKGISPDYRLTVETEMALETLPANVKIAVAHGLDVKRETGVIGIRGGEELTLSVESAEDLQRVDVEEFTRAAAQKTEGWVSAFRFFKPAFSLRLKAEAVQPEIEAVANNSIRIASEQVTVSADIGYTIKRAGVFSLKLALPAGYRVQNVLGENILQWMERTEAGSREVEVTLKERTIGHYSLRIDLFQPLKELTKNFGIVGVQPLGVEKLTGTVGVTAEAGIALKTASFDGLMEIPAANDGSGETGSSLAYKFISAEPQAAAGWRLSVETETVQPWLRVEVANTITVHETHLGGRALVRYEIQNAPVKELRLRIPAGFKNVDVSGANIRRRDQEGDVWKIELQNKIRGTHTFVVTWEQARDAKTNHVDLTGVGADGVDRETGFIAIVAKPPLQISESSAETVSKIDVREFPDWAGRTDESTVLVYRYSRPGYKLAVQAQRFDEADVLQALIENARFTTVVADDGQTMTEMALSIRNNGRQFLEVDLPNGATVWSAFVAGQPVRPNNREGKLLLALEQSSAEQAINVQLTYVATNRFPRTKGELEMISPTLDLPFKNARWEFFLPPNYSYNDFKGTMTHEVAPMVAQPASFTIAEYERQEVMSWQSRKAEVRSDIACAQEKLSKGDFREAGNVFNRAKSKSLAKDAELDRLERDLRQAQASNLVVSQNDFTAGYAGNGVAGQKAQRINLYDNKAAEAQWTKLQQAQEIVAAKVQPLRVNLPIRGLHHAFSQVLQTEPGKPMKVQFAAVNLKKETMAGSIGVPTISFCALWAIVAWVGKGKRREGNS